MRDDEKLKKLTKPYGAFKKNALGLDDSNEDEVKKHYLRGAWGKGTLKGYNSGVVKLLRFAMVTKVDKSQLLPISPAILKRFVVWASKKEVSVVDEDESVKASTLKTYIAGIKAWHMFHDETYPHQANEAVKTLLKATKMVEAQHQLVEKKRPPVLVSDLVILLEVLPGRGEKELAMLSAALIAFWGTARLGELLSDSPGKVLPQWSDLEWAEDRTSVKINLVNAKTAQPGEIQALYLHRQDSLLDPVSSLEEWWAFRPRKMNEEIFSLLAGDRTRRLGKQETITHLRSIWNARRTKRNQILHGHSFRIGGASLRWNLGASREEIMEAGRWTSDSYQVYLRKFTEKEMVKTRALLRDLRWEQKIRPVSGRKLDSS